VIVGGQVGKSCTGFAVGPRKVLTAAHCLWSEKTKNFAKAGDVGLNFTIGSSMLHYKVESLSPHPFYVPEFLNVVTGSFDLAVLTLAETLDPRILALKPAVVTETTAVKQLIRKKSFIFMGYGGNNQLMMGTDIPIPNSICLTDPQVRAKTLRISCSDQEVIMFCAGPDAQDAKITKGDSGGPAFLIENGVPMVFGMSIAFTEKFSFFETFDRKDTRFWLLSQIKE
jgi:secreted trypsin-like serine protease